jgi:molybdopterin-guanine dinucleotide biosynthesis protein A
VSTTPPIACIILAGGLATRMGGGDKCRQIVGGQSIIARTLATLAPQASPIAVNANGDPARFQDLGLAILPDPLPDHPGPLAGILAGLEWAATMEIPWLVSVPGDCPFLPPDLVPRLLAAKQRATYAVAASGGWTHPVIALWPTACRHALHQALLTGQRKIDAFTAHHETAHAEWPTTPVDPFLNVNTPADLAEANRLARSPPPSTATPPAQHHYASP